MRNSTSKKGHNTEGSKKKVISGTRHCRMNEVPPDFEKWEIKAFFKVTSEDITDQQKKQIEDPARKFESERSVLAVHWHPEFIPMMTIRKRIDRMFPNSKEELIIPTQHNELMELNGYHGVEVDCYSKAFERKVQLLLHFKDLDLNKAGVLISMLEHTFKYRSRQLFDLIDSIILPSREDRRKEAVFRTGASEELVEFIQHHTERIDRMLKENGTKISKRSIKNKILRNYFDELREFYDKETIDHAQVFIKAMKKIVKRHFDYTYFYSTEEVIREARALNAGIIIPHPEQFWPILLADYDVDGFEVWNPQSREYTDFLVKVLLRHNKEDRHRERPLLVFMGDDTHLGEKVKPKHLQDPEKAGREIGYQPPWDEPDIQKNLIIGGFSKEKIIKEYKRRLEAREDCNGTGR